MQETLQILQHHWHQMRRHGGIRRLHLIHQPQPFPETLRLPRPPSPTPFYYLQLPLNRIFDIWTWQKDRLRQYRISPHEAVCWTPGSWCCTAPSMYLNYLRLTLQQDGMLVGMRKKGLHDKGNMHFHLVPPADPVLISSLQRHLTANDVLELGPEDSRLHAANCLLIAVAVDLHQQQARRSPSDHLTLALGYIGDHCHQPIGRDQVAAAVGVSPTHLSRLFAAHHERGVQAEILQKRMQLAARLLSYPEARISQVAQAVGIADPSQFTRNFRQVHGCTPRQWCRRHIG